MEVSVPRRQSRVVIIGAGAVGSHLVASIRPEVPLLIVDREERVRAAYAARGIEAVLPPDPAEGSSGPQRRYFPFGDVVVLATSAARVLSASEVVPADIPIVSVTNGLTPELTAVRNGSVAHGVVEFAVSIHSP